MGSRAEWASVIGSVQRVVDVAVAVQDAAIVRLAAIEPEWLEDGTEVETHRVLGHVALDAPGIVSGVLACAEVHAQRRVQAAVLLAADGPDATGGPDGPEGTDGVEGGGGASGLGGLHEAMGAGRLDPYRAGVVAEELEAAPAEVRATVVTLLEPYLGVEDGAHLRRRCRRALARISPDLLRQRALTARAECGLRRWVSEPGVDRWEGTFPSEDAATAWAAVDALAHRYVKDGVCTRIEAARGKALTDLVAGQASIDTVLTITVPATGLTGTAAAEAAAAASAGELPGVAPAVAGSEARVRLAPGPVPRSAAAGTTWSRSPARPGTSRCSSRAPGSPRWPPRPPGPRPRRPTATATTATATTATGTTATGTTATGRRRQRHGGSGDAGAGGFRRRVVEVAPCHPDTGALLDPAAHAVQVSVSPRATPPPRRNPPSRPTREPRRAR